MKSKSKKHKLEKRNKQRWEREREREKPISERKKRLWWIERKTYLSMEVVVTVEQLVTPRWAERERESYGAWAWASRLWWTLCFVLRNFNCFVLVENLKFCQVSILKCFIKMITFQLLLKYPIQTYYIIGRNFNIQVQILYLV